MKFTLSHAIAPFAVLVAAPVLAGDPEETAKADTAQEANDKDSESKSGAIVIPEVKAEEKRICRYVKLDMSSRRKSKVCKTADEWRAFNQRR